LRASMVYPEAIMPELPNRPHNRCPRRGRGRSRQPNVEHGVRRAKQTIAGAIRYAARDAPKDATWRPTPRSIPHLVCQRRDLLRDQANQEHDHGGGKK
jgi:hypothetical protein